MQTSIGVSKKYYSNTDNFPIHGSGKGTGSAGTEWVFISIPMIKVIEQTRALAALQQKHKT